MSKDTLLICHGFPECGCVCAHGKSHEPIIMHHGGAKVNYCKQKCVAIVGLGHGKCCQPVKMNTKWDA